MASVGVGLLLASSRSQPQLTLGFSAKPQIPSIPTLKFSPTPSTFRVLNVSIQSRCICSRRLQINQKLLIVSATKPNSGSGKSGNEGSDVKESSSASQGPPLLTILAGFFVLFLVGWVIVSILTWLIGLIVNVPPPK